MLELHLAASRGYLEIVEDILTKEPSRVNEIDEHGNSALHRCGHLEMIKCLLRFGADPNMKNRNSDRPLDMMKRRGVDEKVLEFMYEILSPSQVDDECEVLLTRSSRSLGSESEISRISSRDTINLVGKGSKRFGLLSEFATSIGSKWFLTLISFLLMLSFVSAYFVTVGLAGQLELVPVDAQKSEL